MDTALRELETYRDRKMITIPKRRMRAFLMSISTVRVPLAKLNYKSLHSECSGYSRPLKSSRYVVGHQLLNTATDLRAEAKI